MYLNQFKNSVRKWTERGLKTKVDLFHHKPYKNMTLKNTLSIWMAIFMFRKNALKYLHKKILKRLSKAP